jgi:hypothetical protein
MSAPGKPERFLLLLRDVEGNDPEASPATNRLKRALKCLLRSFGLRCDRVEEFASPPAPPLRDAMGSGTEMVTPLTPERDPE